jgi:hypothetical protein
MGNSPNKMIIFIYNNDLITKHTVVLNRNTINNHENLKDWLILHFKNEIGFNNPTVTNPVPIESIKDTCGININAEYNAVRSNTIRNNTITAESTNISLGSRCPISYLYPRYSSSDGIAVKGPN